jgi:S-formylglutathione hydrolase FrmB
MNRFIIFSLLLCLLLLSLPSLKTLQAAGVDTVSIRSVAMHASFKCVVIRPGTYKKESPAYPVVYILHGSGGWYSNLITRIPELKLYSDQYNMLIVCPDGGPTSWYYDSPIDSSMRYETYIGTEVPAYIDQSYNTIKKRNGRAITGLSMGGHGALFLGFRHAGRFGACGTMSGAVDLNSIRTSKDLVKRIGDTLNYAENWKKYSVLNVIEQYPKDSLAIIVDCGINDFLFQGNRNLHDKMLRLNIPHDYIERPGKHEWPYWRNAVKYQLLFFRDYFDRATN